MCAVDQILASFFIQKEADILVNDSVCCVNIIHSLFNESCVPGIVIMVFSVKSDVLLIAMVALFGLESF